MLKGLIRFALRQRLVVFLGTFGLLIAGLWAFSRLPIEAFPDVLNELVQVITLAPGQSAEDIERKITVPLEREFSGIPKVIQTRSISEFGLSVIYLYFDDTADKYWARSQVVEKMAVAELPTGVQAQLAPMAAATGEVLRYQLSGAGYSTTQLRTLQDWTLEKQFRAVPGIADVVGFGGKVRTWDVVVDPLKLATFGLTIRQVSDALANSNANAGGNMISWPSQSFVIRSIGEYRGMDDIGEVGVTQAGNTTIRIRDVAQIRESAAPVRGVVGRDDKDDVVQGIVLLRKGENPVSVGRLLHEKLAKLNRSSLLPEGVQLEVFYDRMRLVAKTTRTVGLNLLEGLVLVGVVLFFTLRHGPATVLVCAVVPLSLLFAFVLMIFTHTPANLISLGAIDFGIIVDGAVIIVEYVLARLQSAHAATRPWSETLKLLEESVAAVVQPVFFSMVIIVLAYLPILTLQQVEGKMFSPLAKTICFALLGALLLSLTLVPAVLYGIAKRTIGQQSSEPHEPQWLEHLRARYLKWLGVVLDHPKRLWISTAAVLAAGVVCFAVSGTEFLPELDEGALWIRARFPHSMSLEQGVQMARQIRQTVRSFDEVSTVVSQLGGPEDGTDPNLFDNCEFLLDLKPKEKWKRFGHERQRLQNALRLELEKIPGVDFNISQPIADNVEEAISGVKGKNAAKIFGQDLNVLNGIADELVKEISSVRGTVGVAPISTTPMVPHLTVRLDRVKVAQAGLTLQDVNDLVEIAVGGKGVTQVYDGETRVEVVVRAAESFRRTLSDIRNLPIPLQGGKTTRLERLASVSMVQAPQVISREQGFRRVGVKFDVEGRDLGSTMKEILKKAQEVKLPPGYFVEWGGEYQNQKRSMARLMVVLPLTVVAIAVLLFIFFEDLYVVGATLCTLAVAMVGSIVLLLLRGIPFSVSAAVGLLALLGVMALNNVTLVSAFLDETHQHAKSRVRQWVVAACSSRFRSVVMTSVLAAIGLLPAAVSHGIGSETQKPLATAVIGGMVTGLPAVLLVLPALLDRWKPATPETR